MQFRTAYGPRVSVPVEFHEPTRTQQQFKKDCDINTILAQFSKTGLLPTVQGATYGDFTNAPDYRESLHFLQEAQDSFDSLPSAVRKRFGNDPAEFLDFMSNPDNLDEAVKLGLVNPPSPVSVVDAVDSPLEPYPADKPSTKKGSKSAPKPDEA